ncbi:DUF2993 domain-containing protein [Cryobacterium frigoriphilum]|uniref:DUF2993 domain-containing protein n=1 Tax=Cryobacterium frigoriphilum TaxID=1259150 RepID=A0A4R8ZYP2_9MICO|nr:DUF2993 domain-containing protein [Cryobacterium frigoriphilum]TFD48915.1 DUF2993 domain-containing protein [Cryobacterium frigoriphilum]
MTIEPAAADPTPEPAREPRRKRGRGRTGGLIIFGVLLLMLVGAFFLVDAGARSFAQGEAEKQISESLPASVTGDVTVDIGGVSVIAQFIAGSFDQIELTAPDLVADGVPASVHVVARDVPTNTAKYIGNVEATLDFDQAALNSLIQSAGTAAGTELTLGDGDATYGGTLSLAGFEVGYTATATPSAAGDSLVFTPTSAEVTSDLGSADVSGVVDLVLGQQPIAVCVAQYLPQGVTMTGVDVTPERARITLESSTLTLTAQSLTTLGSCAA